MPRSRPTSRHSDCAPPTDAPTFQPPGRDEVRHGGRRIPRGLRIRAPPAEAVGGEAADPDEAREQCGHERRGRVRAMDLGSSRGGRHRSRGRGLATSGRGGSLPERCDGWDRRRAGQGRPGRNLSTPHRGRLAGRWLCISRTNGGRRRRGWCSRHGTFWRGRVRRSVRFMVGSRALQVLALGSRLRLLRGRALGGCGLGCWFDLHAGFGSWGSRWHEGFRIEVAGLVRRLSDAQMHVGPRQLAGTARPERAYLPALGDGRSLDHRDRLKMEERDREAVRRSNRDRATAGRHRAGK